jgi:predicted MPP superfamily phosphohydrolase
MDNLKTFVEEMMGKAREIIESGEDMVPVAFRLHPDQKYDVIGIDGNYFETPQAKNALREKLKHFLSPGQCIVLLLNAWYLVTSENLDSIGNHPDRKEAITCNVFGPGMKPMFAAWTYDRKDDKILFAPEIRWATGGEGRFSIDFGDVHEA